MSLTLSHHYNQSIDVGYQTGSEEQCLFTYVYVPNMPPNESPKPYFHPMNTLGGNEISCYRPYDHLWHKGLQMTLAHLTAGDGEPQNFWGGGTYVHGSGYENLPNNGSMEHKAWTAIDLKDDSVVLVHNLDWITQAGDHWLTEERRIEVNGVNPDAGQYFLDVHMKLTNVWNESLHFGSPTTAGRPNAGYGGLFWRGPRAFTQSGKIWTSGGLSTDGTPESEIMGSASEWLAYTGRHDGTGNRSTLLFLDHPSNVRYPTKWFVRRDPFACVSFAFSFDEELELAVGATLAMKYRIVICDGSVEDKAIGRLARAWSND